jgi:hypothetical protein
MSASSENATAIKKRPVEQINGAEPVREIGVGWESIAILRPKPVQLCVNPFECDYFGAAGVRPAGAAVPLPPASAAGVEARPGGMLGIDSAGGLTSAGLHPLSIAAKLKIAAPKRYFCIIEIQTKRE